jgi:hypothetical protein
MSKSVIQRSQHLYDFILNFYPKNYRQEFGEEMKFVFSESLRDAYAQNGEQGILSIWGRTLIDSLKSAITEHLESSKAIQSKGGESMKSKNIIRPAAVTLIVLFIPFLLTMIVPRTDGQGFNWTFIDFAIIGVLVFATGFMVELANMKFKNKNHKLIAIAVIVLALLVAWVHLAVGIVDTWPLAGS